MTKESKMKSAYELALERLESQGIERPKAESLPEEVREEIAEARHLPAEGFLHFTCTLLLLREVFGNRFYG